MQGRFVRNLSWGNSCSLEGCAFHTTGFIWVDLVVSSLPPNKNPMQDPVQASKDFRVQCIQIYCWHKSCLGDHCLGNQMPISALLFFWQQMWLCWVTFVCCVSFALKQALVCLAFTMWVLFPAPDNLSTQKNPVDRWYWVGIDFTPLAGAACRHVSRGTLVRMWCVVWGFGVFLLSSIVFLDHYFKEV